MTSPPLNIIEILNVSFEMYGMIELENIKDIQNQFPDVMMYSRA